MILKIARLDPTELFNAAALFPQERRPYLESIEELKVHTLNYKPVTAKLPSLLRARGSLFGDLPEGSDAGLLKSVVERARSAKEGQANEEVAASIIAWRRQEGIESVVSATPQVRIGGQLLKPCQDVVLIRDGKLYATHFSFRASQVLTSSGADILRSTIHHSVLIGDLRDGVAAIVRVPKQPNKQRAVLFQPLSGVPKHSFEDVLQRLESVYTLWEVILMGRRAAGSGATGTLI